MLHKVRTSVQKLEDYENLISAGLFRDIKRLSEELNGLKVNMVNSTPRGGGVAEILRSLVPLMKGVGLKAEWYNIPPKEEFFKITKEIHNALQGKEYEFPFWQRVNYLQHIERSAFLMREMKPDIWVVHDPQPAGVILYLPHFHPSVCHMHIDLTAPNKEAWDFISGFLGLYNKVILSSRDYVSKDMKEKAVVFPPAIDPLSSKNQVSRIAFPKNFLKNFGIDPSRPLISQISRFDPWKGFPELIEAYRLAKRKIPGLQLALVGFFLAKDDPEGMKIYKLIKEETKKDSDIFLFSDVRMLGSVKVDEFVNAIQRVSDVILQNSIREGFGLSVTEAMWKEKAVIGNKAGGIKIQIKNGKNGFLTSSPEETAKKIIRLIKNPRLTKKLGKAARETVKEKFLMPRLLRDYLKLFKELL
ncbi:MAG: glycosyltransferase [Candidatus Paceibacterota bacterium]